MEKNMNTTEADKSLEWYLNGGDDEDGSVPTTQNEVALKGSTAPMKEPIEDARQQEKRTEKSNRSVPRSNQSNPGWHGILGNRRMPSDRRMTSVRSTPRAFLFRNASVPK